MAYEHLNCQTCGQRLSYELEIDKGTVEILTKMARFIRAKGINAVHLSKEMLKQGIITHHQVGNISRPRFHGLVARIKGEVGNFGMTQKGMDFLRGEPIARTIIIKKAAGPGSPAHVIGHSDEQVTIHQIDREWGDYWSGNGYIIEAGRVITEPPVKNHQARLV